MKIQTVLSMFATLAALSVAAPSAHAETCVRGATNGKKELPSDAAATTDVKKSGADSADKPVAPPPAQPSKP